MPTILFIPKTPLPRPAGSPPSVKLSICPTCASPVSEEAETCSGCGQPMPRPRGSELSQPHKPPPGSSSLGTGAWLAFAILLVLVVGGPMFWWRSQYSQVPKTETEWQQKARLQSEAEGEMLNECTNVVVGLTRVIRASVSDADDNPYKWSGDVTAEYVNHVGGVERTNVFFRFGTDTGGDGLIHLRCNSESEAERRARQHYDKREFGRWFDRLNRR